MRSFFSGMMAVCGILRPIGCRKRAVTANQSANAPTIAASKMAAAKPTQKLAVPSAMPRRITLSTTNMTAAKTSAPSAMRFILASAARFTSASLTTGAGGMNAAAPSPDGAAGAMTAGGERVGSVIQRVRSVRKSVGSSSEEVGSAGKQVGLVRKSVRSAGKGIESAGEAVGLVEKAAGSARKGVRLAERRFGPRRVVRRAPRFRFAERPAAGLVRGRPLLDAVMRLALLLLAALASGCAPRTAPTPVSVPGVPAAAAEAPAVLNGTVTPQTPLGVAAPAPLGLPEGSVVTVRLENLLTHARVSEQTIRPTTESALPFAIPYSPRGIDPAGRYGVRAEIRDAAGVLLWASPAATAVFTNGAPLDGAEVVVLPVRR